MKRSNQKGSALIFALIFVLVLSVTAASLMFLSQSETWASMNYRMMTQARYAAEAGVHATANYIMNTYTPPGGAADPLAAYDMTVSPVQVKAGGAVVYLSSMSTPAPTYPVAAVQTAFNNASSGALTIGSGTVNYVASAELLSMQQVNGCAGNPSTLQTWKITADGNLARVQNAQVEVSAILEHEVTPCFNYAAFGTSPNCSALNFGGGALTNSYDSTQLTNVGGVPTANFANTDGNVGANGNLNENGNKTTINGTLSTPDTGVGNCAAGAVDAWTDAGGAQVTGGTKQLPAPVVYPDPVIPPPGAGVLSLNQADCSATVGCSGKKGSYTLDPSQGTPVGTLSLGDINLDGGATVTLGPGIYNINSLSLNGNSVININPGNPPQAIILNVTGANQATPIDFTGGSLTNSSLNPAILRINYAGTGQIKLAGGASAAGVVNAPNAALKFTGGADWYGAVIGKTVDDSGGTAIHYDRHLQTELFNIGNYMLDSFSWSKF
jgi:type IV pilus assembly PilX-like protein